MKEYIDYKMQASKHTNLIDIFYNNAVYYTVSMGTHEQDTKAHYLKQVRFWASVAKRANSVCRIMEYTWHNAPHIERHKIVVASYLTVYCANKAQEYHDKLYGMYVRFKFM